MLGACTVGPSFHRPLAPEAQGYLHAAPPGTTTDSRDVQVLTPGEIPGTWWQLFHSQALDEAVRSAIANSPTLAAANATLAQASEAVVVARAGFLPRIGATANVQHSHDSSAFAGPQAGTSLYSVGGSASYNLDIFGGTRRTVEQQAALAEGQRYQLAAAYLTLTGNVVSEALTIASTRLQIATTEELIASDRRNLALAQRELEVGVGTRADVLTADSQLAADLTTLPTLHQQLDIAYDELSVLTGHAPAQWQSHEFDIAELTLPHQIPLSVPAQLTRQRPDVLAAEQQLHAASAAIGVALAQEFPDITLTASLTREAVRGAGLFHDFETLWNVGSGLTEPVFEGGALRAQVRGSRAAFQAQAALYESTVLEALGQVADDLWALQHDAERLTVDRHSVEIASEALRLQQRSYSVGTTNVLNLINAQRVYAQARLSYAMAQVEQFQDTADLLVALGGGWWQDSSVPGAARVRPD